MGVPQEEKSVHRVCIVYSQTVKQVTVKVCTVTVLLLDCVGYCYCMVNPEKPLCDIRGSTNLLECRRFLYHSRKKKTQIDQNHCIYWPVLLLCSFSVLVFHVYCTLDS